MFCYFYDDLPNVSTLKKTKTEKKLCEGLGVVECLGWFKQTLILQQLTLKILKKVKLLQNKLQLLFVDFQNLIYVIFKFAKRG